jgi:hypothetical protein
MGKLLNNSKLIKIVLIINKLLVNRLAYLTPNLDLVNETTISFQCSKPDLSKYRS